MSDSSLGPSLGSNVDKLMNALLAARTAASNSNMSHNNVIESRTPPAMSASTELDRLFNQFQPSNNFNTPTSNSHSITTNHHNNNNHHNKNDSHTLHTVGPTNPLLPTMDFSFPTIHSEPIPNTSASSLKFADIAAVLQGYSNSSFSDPLTQSPPNSMSMVVSPLKTPRASNKSTSNETTIITKSLDEVMRRHYNMLSVLCRLCGEICGGINPNTKKRSYAEEIRVLFLIDIEQDRPLIHPQKICYKCRSLLDRIRKRIKQAKKLDEINTRQAACFEVHGENCKLCGRACPVCFLYDRNHRPTESNGLFHAVKSSPGLPAIEASPVDTSLTNGNHVRNDSSDNFMLGGNELKIDEDDLSTPSNGDTEEKYQSDIKLEMIPGLESEEEPKPIPTIVSIAGTLDYLKPKQDLPVNTVTPLSPFKVDNENIPDTTELPTTADETKTVALMQVDQGVIEAGNLFIDGKQTKMRHQVLLQSICRLCGGLAIKCRPKEHFGEQIHRLCGIDPITDSTEIHPRYVCSLCCKKFYYRSSHVRPSAQFRSPIDLKCFEVHGENCSVCYDECPLCQIHPKMKLDKVSLAVDMDAIKLFMDAEEKQRAQNELVQKQQAVAQQASAAISISANGLPNFSTPGSILPIKSRQDYNNSFHQVIPITSKHSSPSSNGISTDMQELLSQLTSLSRQPKTNVTQSSPYPSSPSMVKTIKVKQEIVSPHKPQSLGNIKHETSSDSSNIIALQQALFNASALKQQQTNVPETKHDIISNLESKSLWKTTTNVGQYTGITVALVEFGKTTEQVIQQFAKMIQQDKSLAEVIEKLIKRESSLTKKYKFIEGQLVEFRGQPTSEDSQGMIRRALEKLDNYVTKYRLSSRAAAIEELIYSTRDADTADQNDLMSQILEKTMKPSGAITTAAARLISGESNTSSDSAESGFCPDQNNQSKVTTILQDILNSQNLNKLPFMLQNNNNSNTSTSTLQNQQSSLNQNIKLPSPISTSSCSAKKFNNNNCPIISSLPIISSTATNLEVQNVAKRKSDDLDTSNHSPKQAKFDV